MTRTPAGALWISLRPTKATPDRVEEAARSCSRLPSGRNALVQLFEPVQHDVKLARLVGGLDEEEALAVGGDVVGLASADSALGNEASFEELLWRFDFERRA